MNDDNDGDYFKNAKCAKMKSESENVDDKLDDNNKNHHRHIHRQLLNVFHIIGTKCASCTHASPFITYTIFHIYFDSAEINS